MDVVVVRGGLLGLLLLETRLMQVGSGLGASPWGGVVKPLCPSCECWSCACWRCTSVHGAFAPCAPLCPRPHPHPPTGRDVHVPWWNVLLGPRAALPVVAALHQRVAALWWPLFWVELVVAAAVVPLQVGAWREWGGCVGGWVGRGVCVWMQVGGWRIVVGGALARRRLCPC